MSVHLLWLLNAIQREDRRSQVVDASFESHQAKIVLDIWSHGKERSRYFISIRKVMLGDNRRGLLVVHVHVRVGLLELAQWLDAMIGHDEEIGVVVYVLQHGAQYFVEGNVLVGKRIFTDCVDLRVIPCVVRSDGIEPVAG